MTLSFTDTINYRLLRRALHERGVNGHPVLLDVQGILQRLDARMQQWVASKIAEDDQLFMLALALEDK